jgi:lysophospholipase L1-like esterase
LAALAGRVPGAAGGLDAARGEEGSAPFPPCERVGRRRILAGTGGFLLSIGGGFMARRLWGGLLYLVLAALFVVGGLEIGLRLFSPVQRFAFTPRMWDPVVGIKNRPGARGFITCPEYDMEFVISSRGLRDREIPYEKPVGTSRVLCLGDSFTIGFGVRAEETYPKVLERRLAAEDYSGRAWEVLNAGVGGTGTAHQLAFYLEEGRRYEPDVVVLAVCANDFWDNVVSGLYVIEEGKLRKRTSPKALGWRVQEKLRGLYRLAPQLNRSHLWNKIRHAYAAVHAKRTSVGTVSRIGKADVSERTFLLARELLLALRQACRERGCELVVLIVPPLRESGLGVERMEAFAEFVRDEAIPCADPRELFARRAREGEKTNYDGDGHWTPLGHEIAAASLWNLFVAEGLVSTGPSRDR